MVSITIYIEGGTMPGELNAAAATVGNTEVFREKFTNLFAQGLDSEKFDLKVRNFGSVSQAPKTYKKIKESGDKETVLLIDLDAPAGEIQARLAKYYDKEPVNGIIFFMVQKMESWILSQSEILNDLAIVQGWRRKEKKTPIVIAENALLKGIHPEDINNSDTCLKTILTQYFEKEDIRKNKFRNVKYGKMREGPLLIGLLNLAELRKTFSEAERLLSYIEGLT